MCSGTPKLTHVMHDRQKAKGIQVAPGEPYRFAQHTDQPFHPLRVAFGHVIFLRQGRLEHADDRTVRLRPPGKLVPVDDKALARPRRNETGHVGR